MSDMTVVMPETKFEIDSAPDEQPGPSRVTC